jgi:TonB family protein
MRLLTPSSGLLCLASLSAFGQGVTYIAPTPSDYTGKGVLRANSCPIRAYPEASLKSAHQGKGYAKVDVGADGQVLGVHDAQSSGYVELDDAARAILWKCQYVSSKYKGKGVRDSVLVEFSWSLEPRPLVTFDSKDE